MIQRRRLPHIYPENRWLVVMWHLHDSPSGAAFLRQPSIALVIASMFRGIELGRYVLGPFAIMPNHVHILLLPLVSPSRTLKALKGGTAREANRLLHRAGEPFWQRESYDHWIRTGTEWDTIAAYIESNPVRSGLVQRIEGYPWSSANPRWTAVRVARKSACATGSACAAESPLRTPA